jgi:stress response protein SCP2
MVDYNNRDADGVQHSGDHQGKTRGTHTINITLDNLPEKVEWLFFSMSAYNADSIAKFKEPMLHLTNDDSGEEITNYDNSKVVDTRALLICYARKKAMGKWEVNGMSMPSGGSANDYTELSESCIKFAEARS